MIHSLRPRVGRLKLLLFFPDQVLHDLLYNAVRDGEGEEEFLTVLFGVFNYIGGH